VFNEADSAGKGRGGTEKEGPNLMRKRGGIQGVTINLTWPFLVLSNLKSGKESEKKRVKMQGKGSRKTKGDIQAVPKKKVLLHDKE